MSDNSMPSKTSDSYSDPVRSALALIEGLVVEGIKHGHFDYTLTCQLGSRGRRQVIVKAGKSHLFTIEPGDVPQ
jgi:hypothetical protein